MNIENLLASLSRLVIFSFFRKVLLYTHSIDFLDSCSKETTFAKVQRTNLTRGGVRNTISIRTFIIIRVRVCCKPE